MESLNWEAEAQAVINDIKNCVHSAELSVINTSRDFDSRIAYLNIETKERDKVTVKLDPEGFSVVGRSFDDKSLENQPSPNIAKYETIYALLNHISPSYTSSFANTLIEKLLQLANDKNES